MFVWKDVFQENRFLEDQFMIQSILKPYRSEGNLVNVN